MTVSVGGTLHPFSASAVQNEIPTELRRSEIREDKNWLVERVANVFHRIKSFFVAASAKKPDLKNPVSAPQECASKIETIASKAIKIEVSQNKISCPDESFLERDLERYICYNVDTDIDRYRFRGSEWDMYLSPNEGSPENVTSHLRQMSPGLIVSVGTERSFFDLLCADPEKCEGLVVRDINPHVKAYVDFNVLLLRIAESREEYCSLAEKPKDETALSLRLATISEKIVASKNIPDFLKAYYTRNLKVLAEMYYDGARSWTVRDAWFAKVNYHKDDVLFAKLQTYAKAGKIIATVGDINDLSFLRDQRIAVVDASNVETYSNLDVQGVIYPFRLIWTDCGGANPTKYRSFVYANLNSSEREELDALRRKLSATASTYRHLTWFLDSVTNKSHDCETEIKTPANCESGETLAMLREFCAKYFYSIPGFGEVFMRDFGLAKIGKMPHEIFTQFLKDSRLEEIVREFVVVLCEYLDKRYIDFMEVRGWKEEFEKDMNEKWFYLERRIKYFRDHELLEEFIKRFGKDRIAQWKPEYRALLA